MVDLEIADLMHALRSIGWYTGNRELRWSLVPFNLMLPVIGAFGGTIFYVVLRAGLLSPSTSVQDVSPFGFTAVALLLGLFSEQTLEKPGQVAANFFRRVPRVRITSRRLDRPKTRSRSGRTTVVSSSFAAPNRLARRPRIVCG